MTPWLVATAAVLLLAGESDAAQSERPAPAASTPRVEYACAGSPLSVWYEGQTAVLYVDGRLERFRATRSGSGARYTNDRREWFTKDGEGILSAVGQSAATQTRCQLAPMSAWRPFLAPRRYTCMDGLIVEVTPGLEAATVTFRGETWPLREVTLRGGTLYTDGVRTWRGSPQARMLGDAESGATFAFGCHPGVLESTSMLEGTITYRTRQALPAGAVVEVRLVDVSRADAPSVTHARQVLVTSGEQVPIPFALTYASEVIEPGHRYQVQATIAIAGRVRFRTTTAHPVLASDAGAPVVITVQPSR